MGRATRPSFVAKIARIADAEPRARAAAREARACGPEGANDEKRQAWGIARATHIAERHNATDVVPSPIRRRVRRRATRVIAQPRPCGALSGSLNSTAKSPRRQVPGASHVPRSAPENSRDLGLAMRVAAHILYDVSGRQKQTPISLLALSWRSLGALLALSWRLRDLAVEIQGPTTVLSGFSDDTRHGACRLGREQGAPWRCAAGTRSPPPGNDPRDRRRELPNSMRSARKTRAKTAPSDC